MTVTTTNARMMSAEGQKTFGATDDVRREPDGVAASVSDVSVTRLASFIGFRVRKTLVRLGIDQDKSYEIASRITVTAPPVAPSVRT
ncbi:hypothetical protein [Saccharomonospora halophila]|uniref:hypothetical protein n=1 Tax=Saccharomonospora halophila TaxID=129922 RepID=UPI001E3AD588|nr:hypothetical protein [Saccharomonospora halophila]